METDSVQAWWQERWHKNEIGFHLPNVHSWLKTQWLHLTQLGKIKSDACVFVPLCGKTLDIGYFLSLGHSVVACELSEKAVQQLFSQLQLTPKISTWGQGQCYQAEKLCVYVGDFFTLTTQELAQVDYIYDRAAIIALPESTRLQYSQALMKICPQASMLVITLDYQQANMSGPPFAVSEQELQRYYQLAYNIDVLKQKEIIDKEPRFKQRGLASLIETILWLEPKI